MRTKDMGKGIRSWDVDKEKEEGDKGQGEGGWDVDKCGISVDNSVIAVDIKLSI
jgi:hypothetical protein